MEGPYSRHEPRERSSCVVDSNEFFRFETVGLNGYLHQNGKSALLIVVCSSEIYF